MGLIGRLRTDLSSLRVELVFARAILELKYSPEQPRVPAGSSDGGQWSGGSSEGGGPDGSSSGLFMDAANRRTIFERVDLRQEEANGGHAIAKHVDVPNSVLISRVESGDVVTPNQTYYNAEAEGSFNSEGDANRYVNDVIQKNSDKIADFVASDKNPELFTARFDSPTGREAKRDYSPFAGLFGMSHVRIGPTFSVGVVLKRAGTRNGFRVVTAYPMNSEPDGDR